MTIRTPVYLACALTLILSAGCTINRPVADDYGQYLANNQGNSRLQRTQLADKYLLPEATRNHHYEFRSYLAGHANLWQVEFGKILDETMASPDIVSALGKLAKAGEGDAAQGDCLVLTLKDYVFTDHAAHITLAINVTRNGITRFDKTYRATGIDQGNKMFWGGVFGMKNAVQQSTKSALDQILADFLSEVRRDLPDTAR